MNGKRYAEEFKVAVIKQVVEQVLMEWMPSFKRHRGTKIRVISP